MALKAGELRERFAAEMRNLSRSDLTEKQLRTALEECDWLIARCRDVIPAGDFDRFKSQLKVWVRSSQPDVPKAAAACCLLLGDILATIDNKAGPLPQKTPAARPPPLAVEDETWRSQAALLQAKTWSLEKQIDALRRGLQDREGQLTGKETALAALTQKLASEQAQNAGLRGQIERLTARIVAQDQAGRPAAPSKAVAKPVQVPLPLPQEQLVIAELGPMAATQSLALLSLPQLAERLAALEASVSELKRRRSMAV